jgi:hypothetical protein
MQCNLADYCAPERERVDLWIDPDVVVFCRVSKVAGIAAVDQRGSLLQVTECIG